MEFKGFYKTRFEPGLDKVIENCRGKNLFFSTEIEKNIDI